MNLEKILTISIAAYNMEAYLEDALLSLANTELLHLLDVIIVNDGSTDGTPDIASRYVEKYPGSFTLVNKENGGYGSTINCSLKLAKGKYIKVLDGDDWVETANMSSFLNFLLETDADVVFTQYSCYKHDKDLLIDIKDLPYKANVKLNISELKEIKMHTLSVKTDLVRNIEITENCFYTDVEWFLKAVLCCNTLIAFPVNIYCYRLEREGQSVSDLGYIKHISEHEYITRFAVATLNENPHLHGLEKSVFYNVRRTYLTLLKSRRTIKNIKSLYAFRQFIAEEAYYSVNYMEPAMLIIFTHSYLMVLPYSILNICFKFGIKLKSLIRRFVNKSNLAL